MRRRDRPRKVVDQCALIEVLRRSQGQRNISGHVKRIVDKSARRQRLIVTPEPLRGHEHPEVSARVSDDMTELFPITTHVLVSCLLSEPTNIANVQHLPPCAAIVMAVLPRNDYLLAVDGVTEIRVNLGYRIPECGRGPR